MAGELGIRQALRKTLREALSAGRGVDLRGIRLGPDLTGQDVALLRARIGSLSALRIGPTSWAVTSASREGWAYLVNVQPSGATQCNCEAGRNGRACKHVAFVQWLKKREQRAVPISGANGQPNAKANGNGAASGKSETLADQAKRLGVTELEALYQN